MILICACEILVSEEQWGGNKEKEKKNRHDVVLATAAASLLAGKMDRWLKKKGFQHTTVSSSSRGPKISHQNHHLRNIWHSGRHRRLIKVRDSVNISPTF